MSSFLQILENEPVIIAEGAVIERLRRDSAITLDPHVLNSSLVYNSTGRNHLETIYRQYIDCACRKNLPMIVLTPTWRANPERISRAGLDNQDVITDCFNFLDSLRETYGPYAEKIFIGGLIGCYGDAYRPKEALPAGTARVFHHQQIYSLMSAGVDFLIGSTFPAFSEALGMAQAMAETACPYILSFIVRPEGILLDGTPLSEAIGNIDIAVSPPPAGYMVNCVHPEVFRSAMREQDQPFDSLAPRSGTLVQGKGLMRTRIVGLQANTSLRSPEELDGREELDAEDPVKFGEMMASLHRDFSLKILGGCCGTDERHIESIIRSITNQNK
jgi:homocysteine S-methyltransferase